jgi:anti-sigma B factor antagonist/stage II sporulation protein AA (anti-sigma F factor antagonist)
MEIPERRLAGSVLLLPSGRIDLSNAEAFKDAVLAALTRAKTALVLDLSQVEYVSSAGLRSLMIATRAAAKRSVAIAVAALSPVPKEIFTISRFHLVVPCFDTVREAFAELDPPALAALSAP